MKFKNKDTCYYHYVPNNNKDILAFDLDSTLIETKSGAKFPKDYNDWRFLYDNTKSELLRMSKKFNIIIFTNQKGLDDQTKIDDFEKKINQIFKELNFETSIFIATSDDKYRKPNTGMYKLFLELSGFHDDEIDKLIYCGDAAGRIYKDKTKDFSIADYYFAYNIDAEFRLPEDIFKQEDKKGKIVDIYDTINLKKYITKDKLNMVKEKKEVVLLVGLPACGKSTITNKIYSDYKKVSLDEIKNRKKMMELYKDYIIQGNSVIVDNTNYNKKQREEFIEIAKKYNYKIKIIQQDIPFEICNHLNNYRVEKGERGKISIITYRTILKQFEEPTKDEGEIIKLNKIYDFNDDNIYNYKFS
jgi:bifunctional polynucleotide phosphatase/kinase